MCFDARVELLQVVNVLAEDLHILQAVLSGGSAPEGKHGCTAFQPTNMYLEAAVLQSHRLHTRTF